MIGKLSGHIDCVESDHLVLMVQGVGYVLFCSSKTLAKTPYPPELCTLFVEHIFKPETQQLCGFFDEHERTCFRFLMNVQGVGVRVALAILSALEPHELSQAILNQDKSILTRAEGVGPKLAGRLVLELKDKALNFAGNAPLNLSQSEEKHQNSNIQDTILGLTTFGYSRSDIISALNTIGPHHHSTSTQDLIRLCLQKLGKN